MPRTTWVSRMLCVMFCTAASISLSKADGVPVGGFEEFLVCLNASVCNGNDLTTFTDSQQFDGSPSATLVNTYSGGGATISVNDAANGAPGTVGATASSTYTVSGSSVLDGYTLALGGYQDVLTISDPSLNGQAGLLYLSYSLDGQVSGSPFDDAMNGSLDYATVNIFAAGPTEYSYNSPQFESSTGDVAMPNAIPFIFGQAFTLDFEVDAFVVSPSLDGIGEVGSSDFDQTLTLTGLTVTDSNGNPVPGATFSAESGATYTPGGVVPEPSMSMFLLLGMSGLILAAAMAKRRARTSE